MNFQQYSNKTHLGGILTIIYVIITITICTYYFFEFKNTYLKDSYTIQSYTKFNKKTIENMEKDNEEQYNQIINLTLIFNESETDFITLDRLFIFAKNTNKPYPNSFPISFINSTNSFPELYLAYKCDENDCKDYDQNLNIASETYFQFSLIYDGFTLDHQNKDKPLQRGGKFPVKYNINLNQETTINNYWKQIIYKEKKGFFHNAYTDVGFYIDEVSKLERDLYKTYQGDNGSYRYFCFISMLHNNSNIIEYIRTKKSMLDLLANVLSLLSNIYFIICFVYKYYSINFDNFKVVETIISNKINNNNSKKNITNFTSLKYLEDEKNTNEKMFSILKDSEISEVKQNYNINFEDKGDNDESNIKMKKISFFQFYINNLYIHRCCKNNQ